MVQKAMLQKIFQFNKRLALLIFVLVICSLVLPTHAHAVTASDWQAGRIIDDTVFMDKNAMTVSQIQQFLDSKLPTCDTYGDFGGGWRKTYDPNNPPPFTCLKDYKEVPKTSPSTEIPASNYGRTDGTAPAGSKSAAELIWDAGQAYNISPKVLLVNLQKESGLITDDWPLRRQLTYAMGAHCPDSGPGGSANCDVNYSGFSLQIREAAALFRYYIDNMQQPWWTNKKPFQGNQIQYNVPLSCGSSDVFMATKATTALYVYTPYQPNQASLNTGYGTGDGCSSYGNRNFWRYYNDWFGSTLDRSFRLAVSDDGSLTQYVIYNNLKQAIPSPDVKFAWGLQNTPLETISAAYLQTLANGPSLDLLFRVNGGTTVYLADSGKKYSIGSPDMLQSWGLSNKTISNVVTGLGNTPESAGSLSYSLKSSNGTSVYMVDGLNQSNKTVLRQYQGPDVLAAIEGDSPNIINISPALFSTLNQAVGSQLTSMKLAFGGNEYLAVSGQRMPESYDTALLYPGVASQISSSTFSRLVPTAGAGVVIKSYSSPNVYVVDNGSKKLVTDPDVLQAWLPNGSTVSIVNNGFVNYIPSSLNNVNSYISNDGSNMYVVANGKKGNIGASLRQAYGSNTKGVVNISAVLSNFYPYDAGSDAKNFIKSSSSPAIYLLSDSGSLHHVTSEAKARLWDIDSNGLVVVPQTLLNTFNKSIDAEQYVTDGSINYIINGGKKLPVDGVAQKNWNLNNPQNIGSTLSRFSSGSALESSSKNFLNYYLIRDGNAFLTVDVNIAKIWNIDTSVYNYSLLINELLPLKTLTRFVRISDIAENNIFAVDSSKWYGLSPIFQDNFAVASNPVMTLSASNIPTSQVWSGVVARSTSGDWYIVDGGGRRTFSHPIILNHWTNNGSLPVITTSDSFKLLLNNNGIIERAIKTSSNPRVYSAESATKRWILSPETYIQQYAPFAVVSDPLINAIPTGSNIP